MHKGRHMGRSAESNTKRSPRTPSRLFIIILAIILGGLGSAGFYSLNRQIDRMSRQQRQMLTDLKAAGQETAQRMERLDKARQKGEAALQGRLARIEEWLTTPIIKRLTTVTIDGRSAKAIKYQLRLADGLDDAVAKPATSARLELRQSSAKRDYVGKPFHPYIWKFNALMVAGHVRKYGPTPENQQALAGLVAELGEHVSSVNGALYALYPEKYQHYGRTLQPGWTSGFGNGNALIGLCALMRVDKRPRLKELADGFFRSYLRLRQKAGQEELWTCFVDKYGYYWIEEYPTKEEPQSRVLNGHICGVQALYSYHRLNPTPESLNALLAAVTTMRRYAITYRYPGRINSYCLLWYYPDYLPARTIDQQKWLFAITGDPFFEQLAQAFETDQAWE